TRPGTAIRTSCTSIPASLVNTAEGCAPRRRLPYPGVAYTEVELPGGAAVVRGLPPTLDRVAVGGERALVALHELQRGEVRPIPQQRPQPVTQAHPVEPGDTPGVEVVLRVGAAVVVVRDHH